MLNLVITHSPRLAAMATNKPFGEDVIRNPAILHRMALRRVMRAKPASAPASSAAEALREQTA